jgi:hypothetical protein
LSKLRFVDAEVLSMPRFCQCRDSVDTEILSAPRFCQHRDFVDTEIMSIQIFCWRLYFSWRLQRQAWWPQRHHWCLQERDRRIHYARGTFSSDGRFRPSPALQERSRCN